MMQRYDTLLNQYLAVQNQFSISDILEHFSDVSVTIKSFRLSLALEIVSL